MSFLFTSLGTQLNLFQQMSTCSPCMGNTSWYHLLYSSLHGTGCGKVDILVTQEKWDFGTTKDKGIYFSSLLFLENDRLITNILGIFYLY